MTTDTPTTFEKNCNAIRQLKWLQREYWDHYEFEIKKLVHENEALLKAQNVSTTALDAQTQEAKDARQG